MNRFLCSIALFLCSSANSTDVLFHWFEYRGQDEIFERPLEEGQYQNPIIAGFYPDPSITRAGDTFYLAHSSFGFAPGVPLFKSTDLVNWQSIGHALTRPNQLKSESAGVSQGIFAPTIRHHKGTFYLVTTGVDTGGNFLVTTQNPEGEWSDPIDLPEIDGIDPDIFFDDDGKVYIAHNGPPEGEPLYNGHRAIWLWEFDLKNQKIVPDSGRVIVNGGVDIRQKPIWIEGPHIYKINGWYYLLCAEGGTGDWHSEVVFRTRSLQEPFVPYEGNPILTQRQQPIDRPNPIASAGHADIVETSKGEWWAVFLATRNYEQRYFNTGRETFLLPVTWQDEWPIILPKDELIPFQVKAPQNLNPTVNADTTTGNFVWQDDFSDPALKPEWNLLRLGTNLPYRLISGGGLTLEPRNIRLDANQQPSFIGRRQQHMKFNAATQFQIPNNEKILSGITAFQSEQAHYFFALRYTAKNLEFRLEKANKSKPEVIAKSQILHTPGMKNITLGIEGDKGSISFYWLNAAGEKKYLSKNEDAKILSTAVAGGFVGTHIGLHVRELQVIEKSKK